MYAPKYRLDAVGADLVVQMVEAEMARAGDYPFDVRVTVHGTWTGRHFGMSLEQDELAVSRLCITPTRDNTRNTSFCFPEPDECRSDPELDLCADNTDKERIAQGAQTPSGQDLGLSEEVAIADASALRVLAFGIGFAGLVAGSI
jgi:hypothetical protein